MSTEAPAVDLAECGQFVQFYMDVTGTHHVTLVGIIPDGATTARTFSYDDERMADWITRHQQNGCNVYFQANETKPDCAKKPAKGELISALCRFADIDPLDDLFPFADERHRLGRVAAYPIEDPDFPPTALIDSGNGLQPIWAVEREPLTAESISRIEAETKAIEEVLGAGGTHNIDRLLRLPGTVNFPNRKKLSLKRCVSRARLIHCGSNVYTPVQAAALSNHLATRLAGTGLVRLKSRKAADKPNARTGDTDVTALMEKLREVGAEKITSVDHLPLALRDRLDGALTARKRLADRWAGLVDDLTETGQDPSRSGADMSLAAMLKAAHFNHVETGEILCAFPHGKAIGDNSTDDMRLRHVARCVLRSHDQKGRAKPPIRLLAGELHIAATAGEAAIIASGQPLFQRGNTLVRPVIRVVAASRGRTTTAACLGEQNVYALIDMFSEAARWERFDGRSKEWICVNPPMQVAQILLARQGQWNFPSIAGVITCPTLKPDGSVLMADGFDAQTRLFHIVDDTLKLHPELHAPTLALAERALALLNELLGEFPFVKLKGPDGKESHVAQAVALSALITPIVRGALSVAPLHAFRATAPGSGKSYLADVVSAIATGRLCPVIAAAPDEAETEKRIAGLLLAGYPVVSIDNVNGELAGDLLCQAIERPQIRIRPLGGSDIVEIENAVSLFATGNQMRVRGDAVRRTLISDLDANEERPELREFRADPVEMVLRNRGHYVSACLMIVRAYIVAGKPGCLGRVASFGDWSDLVRSALVWLGNDDPALSMEAARADDPDLTQLREILSAWAEAFGFVEGFTATEVVRKADDRLVAKPNGEPDGFVLPEFHETLLRWFGERGSINTRRFGKWLASREGRIVDGHKFERRGTASGGVVRWGLRTVTGSSP